jgi:signal transduction histidine kinase
MPRPAGFLPPIILFNAIPGLELDPSVLRIDTIGSMTPPVTPPLDGVASVVPADGWTHALTPALLAGFVGIIVVLLAMLAMGLDDLRNVYVTSEAVTHTYSVKMALQQLLRTALNAETGERGFVITGEPSYLEPFNNARDALTPLVARARVLTVDGDADQQTDLAQLSSALTFKFEELDEVVRQRRESGLAAAQAAVATNVGRRTLDAMRAIVARMEAREDSLLAARVAQAAQSYRAALVTSFATTAFALFAVVALCFATLRHGSARLRATRAAEAQQTHLREVLQQKDDFVALVSHELRTPTNTIVGWARMLDEHTMRPERAGAAIAAINRNADSLRQLIDDLMDTSQLVSGRMRLAIACVDLRGVVQAAIDAVQLSADNKGVDLTYDGRSAVPLLTNGDGPRLKQVVWNLLANAIKFTSRGGSVTIAMTSDDQHVRIDVQDTGDGIDPTLLPHVFERFRQGSITTAGQQGVGLGLAIVRHLAELHGGTVTAHSDGLGHGSTFVVELPRADVDAAREERAAV